jgi:hypothetical protein
MTYASTALALRVLLAAPPERRPTLARDIDCLARYDFDFVPPATLDPAQRARLRALCRDTLEVFELASVRGEAELGRARIERAIAEEYRAVPSGL